MNKKIDISDKSLDELGLYTLYIKRLRTFKLCSLE